MQKRNFTNLFFLLTKMSCLMLFSSLYFFSGTLSCEMREGPFRSVRAASRFFPPTTEKRNSNAFFFFSFLLPTGTGNTSGPGTRNHKKEQPKMGTHKGYTKIPRTKEHENEKKEHTHKTGGLFSVFVESLKTYTTPRYKSRIKYIARINTWSTFFSSIPKDMPTKKWQKRTRKQLSHIQKHVTQYTQQRSYLFFFKGGTKIFFIYEKTTMMPANMFRPSERKKSNGQRTENQSREYVNKKLLF